MINKKAQIAQTIDWIVAFLIIVFLMALFVAAALALAGQKKITQDDKIFLSQSKEGSPKAVQNLQSVLNAQAVYNEESVNVKNLLILLKKDKSPVLTPFFDSTKGIFEKGECYIICVDYVTDESTITMDGYVGIDCSVRTNLDLMGRRTICSQVGVDYANKGFGFAAMPIDDGKIVVQLFEGGNLL